MEKRERLKVEVKKGGDGALGVGRREEEEEEEEYCVRACVWLFVCEQTVVQIEMG